MTLKFEVSFKATHLYRKENVIQNCPLKSGLLQSTIDPRVHRDKGMIGDA